MGRFSRYGYGGKPIKAKTALKRAVKQYLAIKGWKCWHNLQGLGSYPGLPDLTAVKNDHMGGSGEEAW
mgnify:CR=1 FL=1